MSLDHPALSPPVIDAWEALTDGLLIRRSHLHQTQIRAALGLDTTALWPASPHRLPSKC